MAPQQTPKPTRANESELGTAEGSTERASKIRRIRLACLRCQTRKVRCDGAIPKCSNCHRANVECVDGKKTYQEGGISRSEAAALHDQVQRLQEVLREKCPDVDVQEATNGSNATKIGRPRYTISTSSPPGLTPPPHERPSTMNPTRASTRVLNDASPNSGPIGSSSPTLPPPDYPTTANTVSSILPHTGIAHEIGLIPLSSGASKYVGPSSGFSFAKLLFAHADQAAPGKSPSSASHESPSTVRYRSVFHIEPTAIPVSIDQAIELSKVYFEYVHVQYPFLHEPSHYRVLHEVYNDNGSTPPSSKFQVTMVLAISATILSKRVRIPFTGEGLCAAAMEHANSVDFQESIAGVQCLLLIAMFTLHSPHLGINPWYLNYQCLAAVLDLGLQRDIPASPSVSLFEREMRTRIFWVIYSIDRILATTLGRPIGLRDEACDLRMPAGITDTDLDIQVRLLDVVPQAREGPTAMACSMMLFQLALLNSEIKYILHSITRDVPKYTYPQIPSIEAWQDDFYQRLEASLAQLPSFENNSSHLAQICKIRYHEIVMLLFRPTPRIPTPTKESLVQCQKSAEATIWLWKELYDADRLSYSWITIHSMCLSTITLLYCIWMLPEAAAAIRIDVLTSAMRASSTVLSASGEHWHEARSCRNKLDDLAAATVRWLVDLNSKGRSSWTGNHTRSQSQQPQALTDTDTIEDQRPSDELPELDFPGIDAYINGEDLAFLVGAPDPFASDFSLTMSGMFSEYQPIFDFNPQQDFNTSCLG